MLLIEVNIEIGNLDKAEEILQITLSSEKYN